MIIGTGEHMGRATAALLLREGARVTLNSRNRARLDRLASSLGGGDRVKVVDGDVLDRDMLRSVLDKAVEKNGSIDGISVQVGGYYDETPESMEHLDEMLDVNVRLPLNVISLARDYLSRGSSIVFTSNANTLFRPRASNTPYSVTKFTMNGIVHLGAEHLKKHGIRVNAVAPGIIGEYRGLDIDYASVIGNSTTDPVAIASVVAFLLSGESSAITGAVIPVDGGARL